MKQRGFTLIEMIVVIVILGILAATAAPLFIDIKSDANRAVLQGVEASMRTASTLVYAKAQVAGQTGTTGTVTVNGQPIGTRFGYPNNADILKLLTLNPVADFDTTVTNRVRLNKATTVASCQITYGQAANATTPPTFTIVSTGC